jgi:hypothetical protein
MAGTARRTEKTGVTARAAGRRERRRWVRTDVDGEVCAEVVSLGSTPVIVRDVAPGGIGIEGPLPFTIGATQVLKLTTPTGLDLGELRVAVVSCRRATPDSLWFVVGFAFLDAERPAIRARIDALCRAVGVGAVR